MGTLRILSEADRRVICSNFWHYPSRETVPRPPRRAAADARTPAPPIAVQGAARLDALDGRGPGTRSSAPRRSGKARHTRASLESSARCSGAGCTGRATALPGRGLRPREQESQGARESETSPTPASVATTVRMRPPALSPSRPARTPMVSGRRRCCADARRCHGGASPQRRCAPRVSSGNHLVSRHSRLDVSGSTSADRRQRIDVSGSTSSACIFRGNAQRDDRDDQ
jgi:hypothetical protein